MENLEMKKSHQLIAMVLSAIVLTACGGGGGGDPQGGGGPGAGGGGGGGVIETPSITSLTNENAGLVAFTAMTNAKAYNTSLQLQGALELLHAGFALADAKLRGLGNSYTEVCDSAGAKTWTFSDNDGDTQLSTGDIWNFTQTNCSDTTDDIADGSWTINFVAFNPEPPPVGSHAEFNFETDLSGTSFGSDYTFSGTYYMLTDTPDDIIGTQIISSDSMVTTLNGGADSQLTNFYFSTVRNDATQGETIEFRGTFSDEMMSFYELSTQTPLTGTNIPLLGGSEMYYEGEFTVSLQTGGVNLSVLSTTDVRINVDLDGNGVYETTYDTTWNDLTTQYLRFIGFI